MLSEAYGGEAMKKSSVFDWHKQFKEDYENTEDDERNGHPKSHRTDKNVVHSDKCLSIRTMAVHLNLDKETVKKA
jgi:hypothetical protein